MFDAKKFGKRLRRLRKENDYTQAEMAAALGVTQAQYSYYESGTHEPSLAQITVLSRLYKVTIDELITGKAE